MSTTPLPPLYARWIEAALDRELPDESRATCATCAMCAGNHGGPLPGERAFNPGTKCCTYFPTLPSFRVGQILADLDGAAGRARVGERVILGLGATPLGLSPPPRYSRHYLSSTRAIQFGVDPGLVCPYLDEAAGSCTIWRHREAVCATFFCKHEGGVGGARSWSAIAQLLQLVERELVGHCVLALGLDAGALAEIYHPDGTPRLLADRELAGPVDDDGGRLWPDLARRVWGRWHGHEAEYYVECARLVARLDWPAVAAMSGNAVRQAVVRARAVLAVAAADRPAPNLVCLGLVESIPLPDGRISLSSAETIHDPVRVAAEIAGALEEFDGRPVNDVLAQSPVSIDPETLAALVHHGILVEPDSRHLPPERPAAMTGLEPSEWLCFYRGYAGGDRAEVRSARSIDPAGKAILIISVGARQLTLDEPELVPFGEHLLAHQHGFRAGDAIHWTDNAVPHSWHKIRDLLQSMLAARMLARLGPP